LAKAGAFELPSSFVNRCFVILSCFVIHH
jgi:hypothetical protein